MGTTVVACALALVMMTVPAQRYETANAYFQEDNIYRSGIQGTRQLALTFDDGPSAATASLLDVLAQHKIRATFFVVGSRVDFYPDVMERMKNDGHVIANHSFSHARLGRRYSTHPEMLTTQIGTTNDAIAPFVRPGQGLYFRAPYGVWRQTHAEFLNQDPTLKHYVGPIYWDIGGDLSYDDEGRMRSAADWDCWSRDLTAAECGEGYLREIRRKKGGVVLMHDIRQRSVTMVAGLLPALLKDGYSFITLDELPEFEKYRTPLSQDVPVAVREEGFTVAAPAK
jgi:peptidoglycan-N-acetylglucosamine deacetylase